MKRIGLLSDTHGESDARLFRFFEKVDEIWHAGDIGNIAAAQKLADFKPMVAVTGNIDGNDLRLLFPANQRFFCEGTDVWITHIGGYPNHYDPLVRSEILANPPKLFVCGHSHILKVIYDKKLDLLYLNPGAAGSYGFQKFRTALRFVIDGKDTREMEIWQAERYNTGSP